MASVSKNAKLAKAEVRQAQYGGNWATDLSGACFADPGCEFFFSKIIRFILLVESTKSKSTCDALFLQGVASPYFAATAFLII